MMQGQVTCAVLYVMPTVIFASTYFLMFGIGMHPYKNKHCYRVFHAVIISVHFNFAEICVGKIVYNLQDVLGYGSQGTIVFT